MSSLAPVASAAALLFTSYVAQAQPAPGSKAAPPSSSAPLAQPPPPPGTPPPAGATGEPPPPDTPSSSPAPSGSPAPPVRAPGIPPYAGQQPGHPYYYPPRADVPDEMPYESDSPVPPGYHLENRTRKGAVIAGAVMSGAGYLIAASVAAAVDNADGEFLPLFIPFIGPFIMVGATNWGGDFGGLAFAVIGVPLILDGLVQTAGGILLVYGLTSPKQLLVRDGAYTADTRPRLRVGPTGIAIEGRF